MFAGAARAVGLVLLRVWVCTMSKYVYIYIIVCVCVCVCVSMMRVVKDFQLAPQNRLSMHVLVVHLPSTSGPATVLCLDFNCSRMRGPMPREQVSAWNAG